MSSLAVVVVAYAMLMTATISSAFVISVGGKGVVDNTIMSKSAAPTFSKLRATIENNIEVDNNNNNPWSMVANDEDEDVVTVVRESLQKRLNGETLTDAEMTATISASNTLLHHIHEIQQNQLLTAVGNMDADAVTALLQDNEGLEMDEATTEAAFWKVVQTVDNAEAKDLPLSADTAKMLHHIFDADMRHLLKREKQTTNVTCMQPAEVDGLEGGSRRMNYVFDDGDHKHLPLMEGRKCEDGNCCDKCSRNIFPTFCQDWESRLETFPELASLTFNALSQVSSATIIQFVRLIERVRRTMAHEYGLDLSTLLPLQAYSRKYVAGMTQKGGGGGEGDFVTLHTDEATHEGYHYSCVIYLSTQGEDFEGGNFVFNDPDPAAATTDGEAIVEEEKNDDSDDGGDDDDALLQRFLSGEELPDKQLFSAEEDTSTSLEDEIRRAGRVFTPFHPTRGSAVIFSSGWENMHEVEKITAGIRYAVPCFFTTCPVPDIAYDQMKVGKPQTDEDIADDWLHLLLAHREEEPMESVGRVKELLMKWHYMCTPLSQH